MPKRFIKRYMPDHETIRGHKHLQFLGTLLHDPNILHLNRRSVSGAFAVGLFMAFVPVPFQMVLGAIGAIVFRVNLPISVGLVWITNPLTIPPIYYFAYKVGTWVLHTPTREIHFQLSTEWVMQELGAIWEPLLLGCLICGSVSAVLGYVLVRGLWRLQVSLHWRKRKRKAQQRQTPGQ
jgi:uncharacterized protein (DUF2062 family)